MLKITLKVDRSGFDAKMAALRNQIPFATVLGLTRTAQGVKDDVTAAIKKIFKSVVPYTARAVYFRKATKQSLVAEVGILPKQAKYLYREIVGGPRDPAIEKFLAPILPAGYFVVPTAFTKVTGSGKPSLAWLRKLVNDLGPNPSSLIKRRTRRAAFKPFLVPPGQKLHPGIWATQGTQTIPLLLFVKQPRYTAKFDFYRIAEASARARFPREFRAALKQALATSR